MKIIIFNIIHALVQIINHWLFDILLEVAMLFVGIRRGYKNPLFNFWCVSWSRPRHRKIVHDTHSMKKCKRLHFQKKY